LATGATAKALLQTLMQLLLAFAWVEAMEWLGNRILISEDKKTYAILRFDWVGELFPNVPALVVCHSSYAG